MGQGLPKAVTSVVVKRFAGTSFRVGLAEMNGWRMNMEDAHVAILRDHWGFFGILDGHGGDQCSAFVARRLAEELADGAPEDDAAMTALALKLDREFLETGQPSGSTATFVIVRPPGCPGGRYALRVGNIGDSRVVLGRADGSVVEGTGSDGSITTDHKPDNPSERERIERTGGHVQEVMGVARVNGDLAVSRSFGDAAYKETGGPAQEDHPVSAAPELTTLECDSTDFILLVCDGISERDFPNREVVRLAADALRGSDDADPALACEAVCRQALRMGSKDNLSCMIVLLGGDGTDRASTDDAAKGSTGCTKQREQLELLPGPFDAPTHTGFRKAYGAMAGHAGLTLAQAVEMRYDVVRAALDKLPQASDEQPEESDGSAAAALRAELEPFGEGPPSPLDRGSKGRTEWFQHFIDGLEKSDGEAGPSSVGVSREQFLHLVANNRNLLKSCPQARELLVLNDSDSVKRTVRVAPIGELRPAVEEHKALRWNDVLADICGKVGSVLEDDDSDGTSHVRFEEPSKITVWLPTCQLMEVETPTGEGEWPTEEVRFASGSIDGLPTSQPAPGDTVADDADTAESKRQRTE